MGLRAVSGNAAMPIDGSAADTVRWIKESFDRAGEPWPAILEPLVGDWRDIKVSPLPDSFWLDLGIFGSASFEVIDEPDIMAATRDIARSG